MRTNRAILSAFGVSLPIFILSTAGCEDRFSECIEGFNCPGDGDGPRSGGASNSGGKGSTSGGSESSGGLGGGGVSSSGGVGNVGGTTAHTGGNGSGGENLGGACGDTCTEEAPHCLEDEATCVECLKHSQCEDEQSPICSLNNTCERCKSDGDCKDVLGLADKPVCITDTEHPGYGSCIGCLDSDDCGGNICDPATDSCIDLPYRAKGVCAPCEHDLECKAGQMCVEQVFTETSPTNPRDVVIGKFCTWTKAAVVGPANDCAKVEDGENEDYPFVRGLSAQNTAGDTMDFCVLRTTTCPAYSDHSKTVAGCDKATAESDQAAANAACGFEGTKDGLCRPVTPASSVYKCTYRCGGTEDCKPSFTCPAMGDQFCSIN